MFRMVRGSHQVFPGLTLGKSYQDFAKILPRFPKILPRFGKMLARFG